MSKITSGSSAITARPIASPLSAMPGPLEAVTPMAPPKDAPTAEVTAAISSSAWKVRTLNRLCIASSSRMLEAGVMGYAPKTMGICVRSAAARSPQASARLPIMLRYTPGAISAGSTP
jgi:hypothetical protein